MRTIKAHASTGLTLTVKIRRDSDKYVLDFDDATFKNAGWVTQTSAMTEDTTISGLYDSGTIGDGQTINTTSWADGVYTAFVEESLSNELFDPVEFKIIDGRLQDEEEFVVRGLVRLDSESGALQIMSWLECNGHVYSSPTSLSVTTYNDDGTVFIAALSDSSADSNGIFVVESANANPTTDTAYYAISTITAGSKTYENIVPFVVY